MMKRVCGFLAFMVVWLVVAISIDILVKPSIPAGVLMLIGYFAAEVGEKFSDYVKSKFR